MDSSDALEKPQCQSIVYYWGTGLSIPVQLPLPSLETEIIQVSAGRTQKAAVTKNGRLLIWEVKHGDDNLSYGLFGPFLLVPF